MSFEQKETVENLKKKIAFWNNKMLSSKNMEERAVLDSKIKEAKHKIVELEKSNMVQTVESHIDAPSIADRDEKMIHLSRGQIMDSGSVFTITI